jgi:hypothetical protein
LASDINPSSAASVVESFSDTSSGHGGHVQYERSSPSHESMAGESEMSGSTNRNYGSRKMSSLLLAITGPSGVGKSALFNAVQTTARHYGYLATAKFDHRSQVPFACIARCISQILRQIMSESSDTNVLNVVKETLEAQYVNVRKLLEWVPELSFAMSDIGDEDKPTIADIAVSDSRAELHFVFVQVIRALAQHRMITLVSRSSLSFSHLCLINTKRFFSFHIVSFWTIFTKLVSPPLFGRKEPHCCHRAIINDFIKIILQINLLSIYCSP